MKIRADLPGGQINMRNFSQRSVAGRTRRRKNRARGKAGFASGFKTIDAIDSVFQKNLLTKRPNQNHYPRVPSQ
jgi:hypothetical protein